MSLKRIVCTCLVLIVALLLFVSCSDNEQGQTKKNDNAHVYPDVDTQTTVDTNSAETQEPAEDTYSIWTDPCVDCAWYFCTNLDVMYQKQICINNCNDPPTVVFEGQCEEHLECNPAQELLESNIPCTTADGYPGTKDKICNKGQIQYTNCKSDCSEEVCDLVDNDCDGEIDEDVTNACGDCGELPEEVCDYIDNNCNGIIDEGVANACGTCGKPPEEICNGLDDNCDGTIDEGQLNACGECGQLPEEICDGVDNDCDGLIDEDLVGECSTKCEKNLQYCVNGNWMCTAKQPKEEICNGLDDDCDGQADEGLDCLCTINDIGVLMPCKEKPLVCGEGYKTCECVDEACTELQLSECLATCHWIPQSISPGATCDKYLGEVAPEECNNHDDNCNEQVYEGLIANCYSGPPETMLVGICLPGEIMCFEGSWGNYDDNGEFVDKLCLGEVTPQPEDICNGTDTNCDGKIDEDKQLEPTDILFIIDLSGSMQEEINAVTTALNKFATHYSDSDVIKWGLVFTASATPLGEQVVLATDLVDFETFMSVFQGYGFSLMGGEEQNYDAIYMAIHNLVGAASLPYELSDLKWKGPYSWSSSPIDSSPPKNSWKINWRSDAKHLIILFSDEEGQTYLDPKITESMLVGMINAADELAVYAFTQEWMIDGGTADNYVALTAAGMKGKAYYLTTKAIEMYNNLLEILDETACGGG